MARVCKPALRQDNLQQYKAEIYRADGTSVLTSIGKQGQRSFHLYRQRRRHINLKYMRTRLVGSHSCPKADPLFSFRLSAHTTTIQAPFRTMGT